MIRALAKRVFHKLTNDFPEFANLILKVSNVIVVRTAFPFVAKLIFFFQLYSIAVLKRGRVLLSIPLIREKHFGKKNPLFARTPALKHTI